MPFPTHRSIHIHIDEIHEAALLVTNFPTVSYVYVRDVQGQIFVLPDGPHRHPRVLSGGQPALYAGDLRIESEVGSRRQTDKLVGDVSVR